MKRFAKILLFFLLGLVLLAAGATAYLRIRYPSERLKEILIATLAEDYRLRLQAGQLRFNLFTGFTLEEVTLAAMTAGDAPAPLAIERIEFAYRFFSLFKRKLEIGGIAIVRPRLYYQQDSNGASNLDDLLAAFADSSAASPADTATATALPVDLNLQSLALTGIEIAARLTTDSTNQRLTISPFDLTVAELVVDRHNHVQGEIALDCRGTALDYFSTSTKPADTLGLRAALAAEIRCQLASRDSLTLTAALTFTPQTIRLAKQPAFSLPALGLRTQAALNLAAGRVAVPELQLTLAGEEQIAARLTFNQEQTASRFSAQIARGRLDVGRLLQLVHTHLGMQLLPALADIEAAGMLDFSGSEIAGATENLQINFTLTGTDLSYRDRRAGFAADHGRLQVHYATRAAAAGASFSAKTDFASLVLPLDSATVLHAGPAAISISGELGADQLPAAAAVAFAIDDFAGAKISGNANLRPAGGHRRNGEAPKDFAVEAVVQFENLELAPFTADSLRGRLSGDLTVRGPSLRALACDFNLRNEPLTYLTSDDAGDIPADHLRTTAQLSVTPDFSRIKLTDGRIGLGLGGVRFTLDYEVEKPAYRVELTEGTLDLAEVIALLPDHLLGDSLFPAPRIAGQASFAGWLQGQSSANGAADYRGEFTARSTNAVYEDSTLGLYLNDVQLDTRWSLTPAATLGEFQARCAAPRLPDYLKAPLPETLASGVLVIATDDFAVRDGGFEIPAWQLKGNYDVRGKFFADAMQVKTELSLALQAQPAIAPAAGLALAGKLDGELTIDQFLPDDPFAPQPAIVSGSLQLRDFEIALDTLLTIHDLDGEVDFAQRYTSQLEGKEAKITLHADEQAPAAMLANAGESLLLYEVLREPPLPPRTPRSHFSIARLEVMGYRLEDIAADLRLGNSRFDLPQMRMKFLDGNFIGNVLVGFGDGSPDQLTYSTALQVSSIDISRLRPLTSRFEKGSRMSADFRLQGAGTTPEQLVRNLSGKLNLTKIENKVAANLLQALDPKGTDRGIQNMRLLLKTKYNVRAMSFEIKNGFIYAALEPIKPWFSPFTLPSPIDFARLPMRYFLESSSSQ